MILYSDLSLLITAHQQTYHHSCNQGHAAPPSSRSTISCIKNKEDIQDQRIDNKLVQQCNSVDGMIVRQCQERQPYRFYSMPYLDIFLAAFSSNLLYYMLRQKQTTSTTAITLINTNMPRIVLQAEQSGIMIWKTGTVTQARHTDMPLQGMSQVAIYSPNISMSPGPIIVISPLSLKLRNKYISTIFHFQLQNKPSTLLTKSLRMKMSRVVLKPRWSPMQPQMGAAAIPATVTPIAHMAKQWSSLRMGMQMSFMYRQRQMMQSGTRQDIQSSNTNLESLSASRNLSVFISGLLDMDLVVVAGWGLAVSICCYWIWASTLSLFYVFSQTQTFITCGDYSANWSTCTSLYDYPLSFLLTRAEPSMNVVPAMRQLILAALNMLSATVDGKQAWLFQSMMAYWLLGLVNVTNSKLNTILPSEKASTAIPDTLFRCFAYCDHRQLSTAIELMDRQEIGTTRQQNPKINRLMCMLMLNGSTAKSIPHSRITLLQPKRLVSAVANIMAKVEGMMVQSRMMELVMGVIVVPWFLRQEKKQMLVAPQMPSIPAANLVSMHPRRVNRAGLSASLSILSMSILTILLITIIQQCCAAAIRDAITDSNQCVDLQYLASKYNVCSSQYRLSLVKQMQVVLLPFVQ